MVVVSLGLFACSSTSVAPASVECLYAWSQETEIAVGGILSVNLESNPTTGFKWELASITDDTVLKEEGHGFIAPESGAPSGTSGKEVWTFRGLKKGKSIIGMEYRRPWEQDVEPDKVFVLTVVVK